MPTAVKLVSFSLFSAAAPPSFFLSVTTPPSRQTSQEMSCGSLNSSNSTAGWFLYLPATSFQNATCFSVAARKSCRSSTR